MTSRPNLSSPTSARRTGAEQETKDSILALSALLEFKRRPRSHPSTPSTAPAPAHTGFVAAPLDSTLASSVSCVPSISSGHAQAVPTMLSNSSAVLLQRHRQRQQQVAQVARQVNRKHQHVSAGQTASHLPRALALPPVDTTVGNSVLVSYPSIATASAVAAAGLALQHQQQQQSQASAVAAAAVAIAAAQHQQEVQSSNPPSSTNMVANAGGPSISPGPSLVKMPQHFMPVAILPQPQNQGKTEEESPSSNNKKVTSQSVAVGQLSHGSATAAATPSASKLKSSSSSTNAMAARSIAKRKRMAEPAPPPQIIRAEKVEEALNSKPQRGKKRENLSLSERLELTRTRNREHAKSTRIRKKARYQELLDREAEYLDFKKKQSLEHLRRRCVVDFMRFRSDCIQKDEKMQGQEGSSMMTTNAASSSMHSEGNDADHSSTVRRAETGKGEQMITQGAESEQDAESMRLQALPGQQAIKKSVPVGKECESLPTSATDALQEASVSFRDLEGCGKKYDDVAPSPQDDWTILSNFVEDIEQFRFSSLASQLVGNEDMAKTTGIDALVRHELACRECVVQQFGPEASTRLSFLVLDSEDGVALAQDIAFAQFSLLLSVPGTEETRVISKGVLRAEFATNSHKLNGIDVCSYNITAPFDTNIERGELSSSSNAQQNQMVLPLSFPSVVSLDCAGGSSGDLNGERRISQRGSTRVITEKNSEDPFCQGIIYENANEDAARPTLLPKKNFS